jgi:hypothetical protein
VLGPASGNGVSFDKNICRRTATMTREEIIEAIRTHAAKHGAVWLTERGAIVLAPNGEAACIKGVGREYFNDDCPMMFISGVVGLSTISTRSGESVGTGVLDERVHERMWSEADNPQDATTESNLKTRIGWRVTHPRQQNRKGISRN